MLVGIPVAILAAVAVWFVVQSIRRECIFRVPADPITYAIVERFGVRSQRDEHGEEYALMYDTPPIFLFRPFLEVRWVGWVPGRLIGPGVWLRLPWVHRIDWFRVRVRDIDLQTTFPTVDDINLPIEFSVDWRPDVFTFEEEKDQVGFGLGRRKTRRVKILKRVYLYIDRRASGKDEEERNRRIEEKLEDVARQSLREWVAGRTQTRCFQTPEEQITAFFFNQLGDLSQAYIFDNGRRIRIEYDAANERLKFTPEDGQEILDPNERNRLREVLKEQGVPDKHGQGLRIMLVNIDNLDIPAYIEAALARARQAIGELKEILLRAIATGDKEIVNIDKLKGIDIERLRTVEDVRKLIETGAVKIPHDQQVTWRELYEVGQGHGQVFRLSGIEVVGDLLKAFLKRGA